MLTALFCLLCFCDCLKKSRVFPRLALTTVFGSISDWFIGLSTSTVIGHSNYL